MPSSVDAALARHQAISTGALISLIGIAWVWLLFGANAGESSMPGPMAGMEMAPEPWSLARYGVILTMWWIMMVAMMLPSAAPTILLYARVAAAGPADTSKPHTALFLAGYLAIWGAFSIMATLLQAWLESSGLIAPGMMASQSRFLSGAVLVLAGIYQLSPLKRACLRQCRNPAQFLSRHYRAGPSGAFRMGALHGAVCVGCCWLLMALLFVGGIMNIVWIAALTAMVAAEKLLPWGQIVSMILGLVCLAWGGVILLG